MKQLKLIQVEKDVWLPQEVEVDETEVNLPKDNRTYQEKVESFIRQKYSVCDELAILRQRETKVQEFSEYFEYVEKCKKQSKT